MLKNVLEDALRRLLPEVYAVKKGLCSCPQCQEDVLALALRALPPKYVSRELGEVFARLELENPQVQVDMLEALLQAADIVIARPRCARAREEQKNPGPERGT
ncbi:MAG: late competence development ComFB family protein [Atribacterota bacterium]